MEKTCKRCNKIKDTKEFSPSKVNKDGFIGICKKCKNEKDLYRKLNNNPSLIVKLQKKNTKIKPIKKKRVVHSGEVGSQIRNKSLVLYSTYGITYDEYFEIFKRQGGRCAICQKLELDLERPLCVDHCHITNKIRGLLCHNCNLGIGHLRDSPILIKSALIYLTTS